MRKLLLIVVTALGLLAVGEATAGRGGSYGSIQSALKSNNADVIVNALERAEHLVCARCVQPVLELLDHDQRRVREVAAWWIARRPSLKAAVTVQSIERLSGSAALAARNAAEALGTFRHPQAISALAKALDSNWPDETSAAIVSALGTIGDPAGESAVVRGLEAAGPLTRVAAAQAYWELRGARSGEPLRVLLDDPSVRVRRQATASIGAFMLASARAKLELLLVSDPDPIVRRNAAYALSKIGDTNSMRALENAARHDPVSYVRSYAQAGLRQLR